MLSHPCPFPYQKYDSRRWNLDIFHDILLLELLLCYSFELFAPKLQKIKFIFISFLVWRSAFHFISSPKISNIRRRMNNAHNCNCENWYEKIQRKLNAKSVNAELLKGMDEKACCAEGGIQFTLRPFAFWLARRKHGKTYSIVFFRNYTMLPDQADLADLAYLCLSFIFLHTF